MDKKPLSIEEEAEARMPQPTSSRFSVILNGMGNGAMLGAAVYVAPKGIAFLRGKSIPEGDPRYSMIATALGTIAGTWYGIHEGNQIESYRDRIALEIVKLRKRVHTLEGKPEQTHAEKVTESKDLADTLSR